MDEHEMDEAPEEPSSEMEPEEPASESEPDASGAGSDPEEPEGPPSGAEGAPAEPEAPADPGGPEPETPPPGESGSVDGDKVQDLIDAIGDLNETITGAVTDPEQLPAEEPGGGSGGGGGGESVVLEPASVDLTPVVRSIERTNELLVQQEEILTTQHDDLLQLQANVSFVFLAVCMLAGVVIGCAVSYVLHDLWRA